MHNRNETITLRKKTTFSTKSIGIIPGQQQQQLRLCTNLKQNNTFALMSSGKQNDNASWCQGFAGVALMILEQLMGWTLGNAWFGWIVGFCLQQIDNTFATIFRTVHFLHHGDWFLGYFDDWSFFTSKTPQSLTFVLL